MEIIEFAERHFPEVLSIYADGLSTGIATFETKLPEWEQWDESHFGFARIAAKESKNILGWASISPVSNRYVYRGVGEVSVYISKDHLGSGIGTALLSRLIMVSETHGLWTLQASIMPQNRASLKLHTKHGFRIIGYREKVGNLNGEWLDNIIMERRSKIVGI